MTVLLVALGAAVGAPLRWWADRCIPKRDGFPWGTLTVNVAGSLILGVVLVLPLAPWLVSLLGTGFCGALTTYSTFSFETVTLARSGKRFLAGAYAIGSVLAGLGAATLGLLIAAALG
ncbi:fluoride efflux transporter CrcB [Symbioplanes lichenis]|uniref:fluoride efflux transporter CrcB n=1 Tax=Symbioplanes lichenis TaxID=1629072 RepID=UPI00273A09EA|nr:fluoride efflux transporter CrcB [Actinoplanes lichenis]